MARAAVARDGAESVRLPGGGAMDVACGRDGSAGIAIVHTSVRRAAVGWVAGAPLLARRGILEPPG